MRLPKTSSRRKKTELSDMESEMKNAESKMLNLRGDKDGQEAKKSSTHALTTLFPFLVAMIAGWAA